MTLSLMVSDDDDNYTRRYRMQPRPHRVSLHPPLPTAPTIGCLHTCGGVRHIGCLHTCSKGRTIGWLFTCGGGGKSGGYTPAAEGREIGGYTPAARGVGRGYREGRNGDFFGVAMPTFRGKKGCFRGEKSITTGRKKNFFIFTKHKIWYRFVFCAARCLGRGFL